MDIASLGAGLANQQNNTALAGAAKAAEASLPKSQVTQEVVKVPPVEKKEQTRGAEDKRLAAVQQGAVQIANLFAVGDTKFTIFKDGSGQYITRFTSLRDGSARYFPEPDVVRFTESKAAVREAFYEASA
jgi:hypothetical protein